MKAVLRGDMMVASKAENWVGLWEPIQAVL